MIIIHPIISFCNFTVFAAVLMLREFLNYEKIPEYNLTVIAYDLGRPRQTTEITVQIHVLVRTITDWLSALSTSIRDSKQRLTQKPFFIGIKNIFIHPNYF